MTIIRKLTVKCDWPGCERGHSSASPSIFAARAEAQADGWKPVAALDLCPIHPPHEEFYVGLRMHCKTCNWTDDNPKTPTPQEAQDRWIAHLPELLSDSEARRTAYDYPIEVVLDGDRIHKARNLHRIAHCNRVQTLCGLTGRHVPGRDGGIRCPNCTAIGEDSEARAERMRQQAASQSATSGSQTGSAAEKRA